MSAFDFLTKQMPHEFLLSKMVQEKKKTGKIVREEPIKKGTAFNFLSGIVPKVGEVVGKGITGALFGDVQKEGIKGIPKHIWENIDKPLIELIPKFGISTYQAFKAPGQVEEKTLKIPYWGEIPTFQKKVKPIFDDVIEGKRPLYEALITFIDVPLSGYIVSSLISSGARSIVRNIKVNEPQVAASIKKLGLTDLSVNSQKSQYLKLAKKYHPDKIGGSEKIFKEIGEANGILTKAREQGMLLKPSKLAIAIRNLAETGLKPVKDILKTPTGTPYLDVKGLLPEQAGTIPVKPYQEYRRLNFGLSTREMGSKRAGVEIIKKNLPAQLEYVSKDAGKAVAKLDFSKLNTIDEAVSLVKKAIPKILMNAKVSNTITNWEKTAKMFEAERKVKVEVKPIPKEIEPFAQEARKYKSAEGKLKLNFESGGDQLGDEFHGFITAKDSSGKAVGKVDYTYFRGETAVKMIEVKPEVRRQGIGIELLKKLQSESDKPIIVQGDFATKEGQALFQKFKMTDFYDQAIKGVKEVKPAIISEPISKQAVVQKLEPSEIVLTAEEERAIMEEAFELSEGKIETKEQAFYDEETGGEREVGYQNFKKFLDRSKKRIDIEDASQLVNVSKKYGVNADYEFFSGVGGDMSNDELLDIFKERYIHEKGGLDVLVSALTPIQRATNRIKIIKPKITKDKAKEMAERIVAKFIPPREETGFIYFAKKIYKRTLDAKYLRDFGEEGKVIYNKIRESETWATKNASERLLEISQALKGLSKNELENFGNYVEGFTSTSKNAIKAVNTWKKISKDIAEKAQQFGVEIKLPDGEKIAFKPKSDYYPYFLKEDALKKILRDQKGYTEFLIKMAEKNKITVAKAHKIIQDMVSNRANFYGHLERPRTAELPLDFYERDPKKILGQYIIEAYDRLGDAMVFGGDDKILQGLIEKVRVGGGDYEEVQKLVDRALQREKTDEAIRNISLYARTFNNLTKLSLAGITNIADISKSFIRTDFIPTFKAVLPSLRDTPLTQKAGVLDLEIMKYAREQGIALTKAGETFYGLTGFKASEKYVRRLAVNSAKNYIDILYAKLKKNPNNVFAKRRLEQFNLDPDELLKRKLKESDYVDAGGIKVIQGMQPVSRVDLPFYWQDPKGKLLTQYKTFSYKQMDFLNEFIFKEAKRGNLKPFMTFLIVGAALGEGVADLKAWARGKKRPKDIPRRMIDNLLTIGGIGLATDFLAALEYGGSLGGQFLKFVAGPTLGDFDNWGTAIYNDVQTILSKEKEFAAIGELSKKGQVQMKTAKKLLYVVPFLGPFLSSKLFPTANKTYTTKTIPIAEELLKLLEGEKTKLKTIKQKKLSPKILKKKIYEK